ncbi:MAG TPA: tRNA preQ1(34) S-adenosylmethionine ribosyltransferase-isomerase QueA [Verrucomicrobiae bacterium]|nr:tRNA preQ1(34) S-adenosylmethionine ribosyltransferase-isomerase QueA [Verrucomicrobiae bacterium]
MRTDDFSYELPPELIAQHPTARRDQSRLMVLHRDSGKIEHRQFPDLLSFLKAGDVLVLNNSRVIRARLYGNNVETNGKFELLLVDENFTNDWWAMMKPGKRAQLGTRIRLRSAQSQPAIQHEIIATVLDVNSEGHRRLQFSGVPNILDVLDQIGELPLPPYIERKTTEFSAEDATRYQTVFAQTAGSVAAPTAGLHFTPELLAQIRALGVEVHFVTLHVGLGTFVSVKTETLAAHNMHEERFEVSASTAHAVNEAKATGRRVIAVGTTTVRVLESVAAQFGNPLPAVTAGRTRIFIYPPCDFKVVDVMLTNFHLPCSTLLMLISAFAAPGELRGREMVLSAYAEAIRERYRFFSYGDATLIF